MALTSVADIAYQLRRIAAVDEWMSNADKYQHFLDGEHMVKEEAPMFFSAGTLIWTIS